MATRKFDRARRGRDKKKTAEPRTAGGAHSRAAGLWQTRPPATRGPKAGLTLDDVVAAGIAIADTGGLSALSMARVAERLGVTTMALYRYVDGKTALVDLMFDVGMGPPPDLEAIPGGWRAQVEQWARGIWATLIAHPWALDVLAELRLPGPNQLAWMECGVRALSHAGLAGAPLLDALFLVVGQVRTIAQYAVTGPGSRGGLTSEQWAAGVGALLHEHAARFPTLAAATAAGAFASEYDPLAFGLGRVLDGLHVLINSNDTGG